MEKNMELEEAIEILKRVILVNNFESYSSEGIIIEAMETVLNHLTRQEKMIELMAYEIDRLDDGSVTYSGHENFIENIKQYFEKKAEENK